MTILKVVGVLIVAVISAGVWKLVQLDHRNNLRNERILAAQKAAKSRQVSVTTIETARL